MFKVATATRTILYALILVVCGYLGFSGFPHHVEMSLDNLHRKALTFQQEANKFQPTVDALPAQIGQLTTTMADAELLCGSSIGSLIRSLDPAVGNLCTNVTTLLQQLPRIATSAKTAQRSLVNAQADLRNAIAAYPSLQRRLSILVWFIRGVVLLTALAALFDIASSRLRRRTLE
jgi:hypothetical protein